MDISLFFLVLNVDPPRRETDKHMWYFWRKGFDGLLKLSSIFLQFPKHRRQTAPRCQIAQKSQLVYTYDFFGELVRVITNSYPSPI